mgnify:CR=1 FL=1
MKSLERIVEFIECRRRNREALRLQQERCEAWEQYHRDTAAVQEQFQEWIRPLITEFLFLRSVVVAVAAAFASHVSVKSAAPFPVLHVLLPIQLQGILIISFGLGLALLVYLLLGLDLTLSLHSLGLIGRRVLVI